MMPASTKSHSPQEVYSNSGSDQWSQENSSNIVMAKTNVEWNTLPDHNNIVPVSSNGTTRGFITNVPNNSVPMIHSTPQSYVNIPNTQEYSRHIHLQNGYPIVSVPNSQSTSTIAVMLRTHHRPPPQPNTWATQQNINLIQTAWNKTNTGGVKKQKRVRTAFTSHQMMHLEQEYSRTRYLDRTRRIELADTLRLNERTIKIWFQNRRMKEKKDRAENLEGVEDVSTTQSPELGTPMFQEQYQANSETYNRMGVFVEQYPVSSTSMSPMPQAEMPPSYPLYALQEENPAQYQQVHFQVQQYPSPYCEAQKLSPESIPQSESSVSADIHAPSDVDAKNWDLSWIKTLQEED